MDKKSFEEGMVVGMLLATQNTESGGVVMTDTLKIIDEAPAIATVSFSDNGWKMVLKKVDGLTKSTYQNVRADSTSANWFTDRTTVYSTIALCVYNGNTLKWVGDMRQDVWKLEDKTYGFTSVTGYDEHVHHLVRDIQYGVLSSDVLTPNVFRLTSVTPNLPSKTSTIFAPQVVVNYIYDYRATSYSWDGTVSGVNDATGITGTLYLGTMVGISSGLTANPDTIEDDVVSFRDAVIAYVNK